MNTKQLTDSDTNAYEIEIWFKIKNQRRRIDLSVRIIHDSEDDELYVFNTIINVSFIEQFKFYNFIDFRT